LEDLNKKGMTLIMVTHDPNLGNRASRKIEMMDGQIIMDSTASAGQP
jgi:putative ABC transport system ATP-binding protein